MPLQLDIIQPSGVTATYHVVMNTTANFLQGSLNNASVNINSYFSSDAFIAGGSSLGGWTQDISPLVNAPMIADPSLLDVIEKYLLTLPLFAVATQVN